MHTDIYPADVIISVRITIKYISSYINALKEVYGIREGHKYGSKTSVT